MHHATMFGQTAVLEIFLHRGARIDIVNMGGDTLLHVAAAWGKYDIVQKVRCVLSLLECSHSNLDTPRKEEGVLISEVS